MTKKDEMRKNLERQEKELLSECRNLEVSQEKLIIQFSKAMEEKTLLNKKMDELQKQIDDMNKELNLLIRTEQSLVKNKEIIEQEKTKIDKKKEKIEREKKLINYLILSKMPTKLKRVYKLIGISTDDDLINFAEGKFHIPVTAYRIIEVQKYQNAKTILERFLSIRGVGEESARKSLDILETWSN